MTIPRPHHGFPILRASRADVLATDADRDEAIGMLREGFAQGQLSKEGHEERVERALRAGTLGDLNGLVRDLAQPAHASERPTAVPPWDRRTGREWTRRPSAFRVAWEQSKHDFKPLFKTALAGQVLGIASGAVGFAVTGTPLGAFGFTVSAALVAGSSPMRAMVRNLVQKFSRVRPFRKSPGRRSAERGRGRAARPGPAQRRSAVRSI